VTFFTVKSLPTELLARILANNQIPVAGYETQHAFWMERLGAEPDEYDQNVIGQAILNGSAYEWNSFGLPFSTYTVSLRKVGIYRAGQVSMRLPRKDGKGPVCVKIGSPRSWNLLYGSKMHQLSGATRAVLSRHVNQGIYESCKDSENPYCKAYHTQVAPDKTGATKIVNELRKEILTLQATVEQNRKEIEQLRSHRSTELHTPRLKTPIAEPAEINVDQLLQPLKQDLKQYRERFQKLTKTS